MDTVAELGVWPCLDLAEQMCFVSANRWPSHVESKVKKWRQVRREISQTLAPLRDKSLAIPGLAEACQAQDLHIAKINEPDYAGSLGDIWDVDLAYAEDIAEWSLVMDWENEVAGLLVDCVWGGLEVVFGHFLFQQHPLWELQAC